VALGFLLSRLGHTLVVAVLMALTVFIVMRLTPGDPVELMLRGEQVRREDIERTRREMGLDQPFHVQLLTYVSGAVRGDLGVSLVNGRPVTELVAERLPATIELALAAMLLSFAVGVPVGVVAALRPGSGLDRMVMTTNFLGISIPPFWLGILLIMLFSVQLGVLPSLGRITYEYQPTEITGLLVVDSLLTLNLPSLGRALAHLALPAVTLGAAYSAVIARVLRSSMIEVLRQDYMRTARSKGLRDRTLLFRHALRNALIPTITVAGLEAAALIGGNVVIETVFSWPGLGTLIVKGIFARDYPVVQTGVIVYALVFTLISLIVDLSYSVVDPRIRWQS
jgi:ABC-type dipeptide/oligopeptide/nickel transport system permease component